MKNKIFLIDSGHGGMINGVYQTDPKIGKFHVFPNGEIAREGVTNRLIKKVVIDTLTKEGFKAVDICPTELDLPLETRCDIVNLMCREYGDQNCIFISLHSNAGGGTGFEIFTSPGQSKSDLYATIFASTFHIHFPKIMVRQDLSDGDPDKESKFYVLVNTRCPAILPEFLFFDNEADWKLLKDPVTHQAYANMILDFIKRVST
jgi:N-acetylmuramoyl-L-alanine amidase